MGLISKAIVAILFVASPLYILDRLLMPALNDLAYTYSNLDQTAESIAKDKAK